MHYIFGDHIYIGGVSHIVTSQLPIGIRPSIHSALHNLAPSFELGGNPGMWNGWKSGLVSSLGHHGTHSL